MNLIFKKLILFFVVFFLHNLCFSQQKSQHVILNSKIIESFDISKKIYFNKVLLDTSLMHTDKKSLNKILNFFDNLSLSKTSKLSESKEAIRIFIRFDSSLKTISNSHEVFSLDVNKSRIIMDVVSIEGIMRSLIFLENIYEFHNYLFEFKIVDYPTINKRFFHLTQLGANGINNIKNLIKIGVKSRFNGVILQIKKDVFFETFKKAKLKDKILSKSELKEIINFSKSNGLQVILEFKLLTHQDRFYFDKNFLINKETYDTNNPELYIKLRTFFDEIIKEFEINGIHIGHDELYGYRNKNMINFNKILDEKDYIKDIIKLYDLISELNLETYMWGDMFLDPNRFNMMYQKSLHGNPKLEKLLPFVPKKIIISSFHYWDTINFDSILFYSSNGFQTFASTWCFSDNIINQTNFIKSNLSFVKRNMIATTWSGALKNRRSKILEKGADLLSVESIIKFSGNIFW